MNKHNLNITSSLRTGRLSGNVYSNQQ